MKKLDKLINIARPTELPKLSNQKSTSLLKGNVMIGKRWGLGGAKNLRTISTKPKEPSLEIAKPKGPSLENRLNESTKIKDSDTLSAKITSKNEIAKKIGSDDISKHMSESKSESKSDSKIDSNKDHSKIENSCEDKTNKESSGISYDGKTNKESNEVSCDYKTMDEHIRNVEEDFSEEIIKPKKRRPKKCTRNETGQDHEHKDTMEDNSDVKVPGDYDISDDRVATWLPPKNQTGDGRTSLNDKYGY